MLMFGMRSGNNSRQKTREAFRCRRASLFCVMFDGLNVSVPSYLKGGTKLPRRDDKIMVNLSARNA